MNSYIMYCDKVSGQHLSHEQFRITLAKQLLQKSTVNSTPSSQTSPRVEQRTSQPLARLTEHHFPAQIEKSTSGGTSQRNRSVCSYKKEEGGRQPPTCANSATYLCVLSRALSCTTHESIHKDTFDHTWHSIYHRFHSNTYYTSKCS